MIPQISLKSILKSNSKFQFKSFRSDYIFAGIVFFIGGVSLIRSTAAQGTDFYVFWNAARCLLNGEPLYSQVRDGGMIFKYPPWIAPFFIPLGLLSLDAAKWIWGFIEVGSLIYILSWLNRNLGIQFFVLFSMTCLYWGLWIIHALDGQVVLPLLAIALGGWSSNQEYTERASLKFFGFCTALTTKVFTVFPLFGLKWTRKSWRSLVLLGLSLIVLSLPALLAQTSRSPVDLMHSWVSASSSAGKLLDPQLVRGRRNPGLPGYFLYLTNIESARAYADIATSLCFAVILGGFWKRASRKFDPAIRWSGWLALTPVIHPLPWWHLFIFTFPLSVYVIDRAIFGDDRRPINIILGIISIVLICLSSEKVFGPLGLLMELNAAKSWGTLLLIVNLILQEFPVNRENHLAMTSSLRGF